MPVKSLTKKEREKYPFLFKSVKFCKLNALLSMHKSVNYLYRKLQIEIINFRLDLD